MSQFTCDGFASTEAMWLLSGLSQRKEALATDAGCLNLRTPSPFLFSFFDWIAHLFKEWKDVAITSHPIPGRGLISPTFRVARPVQFHSGLVNWIGRWIPLVPMSCEYTVFSVLWYHVDLTAKEVTWAENIGAAIGLSNRILYLASPFHVHTRSSEVKMSTDWLSIRRQFHEHVPLVRERWQFQADSMWSSLRDLWAVLHVKHSLHICHLWLRQLQNLPFTQLLYHSNFRLNELHILLHRFVPPWPLLYRVFN